MTRKCDHLYTLTVTDYKGNPRCLICEPMAVVTKEEEDGTRVALVWDGCHGTVSFELSRKQIENLARDLLHVLQEDISE